MRPVFFLNLAIGALILHGTSVHAELPCKPFRIHRQASLPPAPPSASLDSRQALPPDWENRLASSIGTVRTQSEFPKAYRLWVSRHPWALTERERFEWLQCLSWYVHRDTDGDGIPDWSALSDHEPATVLFPADPDMDGDGVPNVLDPDPGNPKITGSLMPHVIPRHLRMSSTHNPERARLQKILFDRFGVIAIDHTDDHAPSVLRELLRVGKSSGFHGIKYIYAFAGHDPAHNIAAYHREAEAISVGGRGAYGNGRLGNQERMNLDAALAHEFGHAFLFEKIEARDLAFAAREFGGWPAEEKPIRPSKIVSYYDPVFFKPHPLRSANAALGNEIFRRFGIVSRYAMTNMHEWFADAFAAEVLGHLGRAHAFGPRWHRLLEQGKPGDARSPWIAYDFLPANFQRWLESKISPKKSVMARPSPDVTL